MDTGRREHEPQHCKRHVGGTMHEDIFWYCERQWCLWARSASKVQTVGVEDIISTDKVQRNYRYARMQYSQNTWTHMRTWSGHLRLLEHKGTA